MGVRRCGSRDVCGGWDILLMYVWGGGSKQIIVGTCGLAVVGSQVVHLFDNGGALGVF